MKGDKNRIETEMLVSSQNITVKEFRVKSII